MKVYDDFDELERVLLPNAAGASLSQMASVQSRRFHFGTMSAALIGGKPSTLFPTGNLPDMAWAASQNLGYGRLVDKFNLLTTERKNALLSTASCIPGFVALADESRSEWFKILMAFADAEFHGADQAKEIAEIWSKTSSKFDKLSFHSDWQSYQPGRTSMSKLNTELWKFGFDFEAAIDTYLPPPDQAPPSGAVSSFFSPVAFRTQDLVAPAWIASGLLLANAITILSGAGGSLKSTFAITLLVALAAGHSNFGPFRIVQKPGGLRVAMISGEEGTDAVARLVAAACISLGLSPAEVAAVEQNLLIHDATVSGWRIGEPAPGSRTDMAPEAGDSGLALFANAVKQHRPDAIVVDTMAACFALQSENDNSAITQLLNRVRRAAPGAALLVLHHTPKMTKESLAAQRGELTAVRGGGATGASARIVLTITGLPAAESGQVVACGLQPDRIRRIEHAKINDGSSMAPGFIEAVSVQIQVKDGTTHEVRGVRFLSLGSPATGGVTIAYRNTAMTAIQAGCQDTQGARVPLSPGGGKNNGRDAVKHGAAALERAQAGLPTAHAQSAARAVIADLLAIGCVRERDVLIPQYKSGGQLNGNKTARGLVEDWSLAPWIGRPAPAAQPGSAAPASTQCPKP
jgi:hypothetical protein